MEIILKTGSYLGDNISELPNGLIKKMETGIGATYVEATAQRNSIIVEPTRSIVNEKAKKHNCFAFTGETIAKELQEYIEQKNKSSAFKKFFVVSDSVPRLIQYLKNYGENVYNTYFYLIDEIEQYQTEAIYRTRMGLAIDYYFEFPILSRALTSATVYRFSNPRLENEPKTTYKYEQPTKRDIDIYVSNNVTYMCIEVLRKCKGKNLIFTNSIRLIRQIIEFGKLKKEDCNIFCSGVSKDKVLEYYQPFTPTPTAMYNFYTASFFSGVDIYGKYNVITLVDVNRAQTLLCQAKLRQIIGRNRDRLKYKNDKDAPKDVIITNISEKFNDLPHNYRAVQLDYAKHAKETIERNRDSRFILEIRKAILEKQFGGISLIRENKDGEIVDNYEEIDYKSIQIDACRELYSTTKGLQEYLVNRGNIARLTTKNFRVSQDIIQWIKTIAKDEETEEEKSVRIKALHELLSTIPSSFYGFRKRDLAYIEAEIGAKNRELFDLFILYGNADIILKTNNGNPIEIKKLKNYYTVSKLGYNNKFLKAMNEGFIINQAYSSSQIAEKLNKIYIESLRIKHGELTPEKAVRALRNFFYLKRKPLPAIKGKKSRPMGYAIIGKVSEVIPPKKRRYKPKKVSKTISLAQVL